MLYFDNESVLGCEHDLKKNRQVNKGSSVFTKNRIHETILFTSILPYFFIIFYLLGIGPGVINQLSGVFSMWEYSIN